MVNIEDTIGFVVCDAVTFVFELVVAYEYMVQASLVETKLLPWPRIPLPTSCVADESLLLILEHDGDPEP